MVAVNIAGKSPPSRPTLWFDTIQAPPASPPEEVTVRAVNETALRVRWTVSLEISCLPTDISQPLKCKISEKSLSNGVSGSLTVTVV